MPKSETTSLDRVDWSIKLFYRPLQERLWGRRRPWEDLASCFTSGRADLPATMALVTLFPPRSQEGSLERHTRTLLPIWGKRDHCGGASSAASQALTILPLPQQPLHPKYLREKRCEFPDLPSQDLSSAPLICLAISLTDPSLL